MAITYVSNSGLIAPGNEAVGFTPEGGLAVLMTNKTGSASVQGMIVSADDTVDNAFVATLADNTLSPIGVVHESGIGDGSSCWVVISGKAYVLLENGEGSAVKGDLLSLSSTAGRAEDSGETGFPDVNLDGGLIYFIGVALETKTLGTDVLCSTLLQILPYPNVLSGA